MGLSQKPQLSLMCFVFIQKLVSEDGYIIDSKTITVHSLIPIHEGVQELREGFLFLRFAYLDLLADLVSL